MYKRGDTLNVRTLYISYRRELKMSKRAVNLLRNMAVPALHNADNPIKGARKNVIALSSESKTLTAADSGAVVVMAGTACTVTLPAVASGLNFKFFANTAAAHVMNGGDSVIEGVIYDNSNGATIARNAATNGTSLTLVNPAIGDHWEVVSDGTSWLLHGWLNQTPTLA